MSCAQTIYGVERLGQAAKPIEKDVAMADFNSMPGFGPVTYSPKQAVAPERQQAEAALKGIPGVQGVGEGRDSIGDPAWIAYVRDESVKTLLPRRVGNRNVVPLTTGEISILPVK